MTHKRTIKILLSRVWSFSSALSMIRNDYPSASNDFDWKAVRVAKSKAAFFAVRLNANAMVSKPSRDQVSLKTINLNGEMREAGHLPGRPRFQRELRVREL